MVAPDTCSVRSSKLVGLLTITDKNGKDVSNPAFEFDGCFRRGRHLL